MLHPTLPVPVSRPPRRALRRRRHAVLTVLSALVVTVGATACEPPQVVQSKDEARDVELVARERSSHHLNPLKISQRAQQKARQWARRMALIGHLCHSGPNCRGMSPAGMGRDWCSLGEAIGYVTDVDNPVDFLHKQFMSSPKNRAIVLGHWDYIGTGVTVRDGTTWVTEIYARFGCQHHQHQVITTGEG